MLIKSYIITIISVVLLSVIAEDIMPDGNMKKHISLIMGIVILIAVSKPVLSITGGLFSSELDLEFHRTDKTSNDLTQKLENSVADKVYDDFQKKLNKMVGEAIYDEFNIICEAETVVEHNAVKYIRFSGEQNMAVKDYIEKRFGIKCVFDEVSGTNEIY